MIEVLTVVIMVIIYITIVVVLPALFLIALIRFLWRKGNKK